ncbi:hypothetical protein [Shewanella xiamenensis]|uniref:hypothetical protein n=1 Tax=Shewanella xiamenensis TaxID=332186 RepID=UPI0021C219A4|nr:hypothetical protein [Shewanella xiamenensis]MCT8876642.1 hypothetical protein [Shewanella xiamenensis]
MTNMIMNTNKAAPITFNDPVLGKMPVIHLQTISIHEYLLTPFVPYEISKELSYLRFVREGNVVHIYKLA